MDEFLYDFVNAINHKFGDKESKEGIRRIFVLFFIDPNTDINTFSSLKKFQRNQGKKMIGEEIKEMIEKAT